MPRKPHHVNIIATQYTTFIKLLQIAPQLPISWDIQNHQLQRPHIRIYWLAFKFHSLLTSIISQLSSFITSNVFQVQEEYFILFVSLLFAKHENHFRKNLCRNPSPRLATKARACKLVGREGSPRVTLHVLGSVRECKGINPHTPKGVSTLGVEVLMDFQIFRGRFQG